MAASDRQYSLGLDFGTESVRAVVVDVRDGRIAARATHAYAHGVIQRKLPASRRGLPPDYALQHPQDWLVSAGRASRSALRAARLPAGAVVGVGVDFTSCTMLPTLADGTPLCLTKRFSTTPLAWPKLWKHHAAKSETDRINEIARRRREPWLSRYGGAIGLEWFFPKIDETLRRAPAVYGAADVWIEAGDWFVWRLTDRLVRSTCQAGYKAVWSKADGYPSRPFFRAVDRRLGDVHAKLPGVHRAPGEPAGALTPAAAKLLGLRAGTPVSTAIIDAHAGVIGAGVAEAGTLVMVLGTSACHMLNGRVGREVPGVAGVVEDGILPGYFGYETGQAAVGDAFGWFVKAFGLSHEKLSREAEALGPGSGGVLAVDWLNGCRTPLMDGRLAGGFVGLTLATRPAQMYRALIEATAFGVRWIVDLLRQNAVPVKRFVASGGLPKKSPLLMQIYADVLGSEIEVPDNDQSVAVGAAILGALSADVRNFGHQDATFAIIAMSRRHERRLYRPNPKNVAQYKNLYRGYRDLTAGDGPVARTMRNLRT